MFIFNATIFICLVIICINIFNMRTYLRYLASLMTVATAPQIVESLKDNRHHVASSKKALSEYTIYTFFWKPLTIITIIILAITWWAGVNENYQLTNLNMLVDILLLATVFTHMIVRELPSQALLVWAAGLQAVHMSFEIERVEQLIKAIEADDEKNSDPANIEKIATFRRTMAEMKESTEKSDE